MSPELSLGSAQFGLDYGITNNMGQLAESETREIMSIANKSGILFLDTAQSYGSSEDILGRNFQQGQFWKIVNKLPNQSKVKFTKKSIDIWEKSFHSSLCKLKADSLDTYLVHSVDDLRREDSGILFDWLESLKERSLVRRIGVSIYESSDLELIPLERIQLVQLPLSIYDQRMLLNGTLELLSTKKISVHARSIFLQGLLLQEANLWPDFLAFSFKKHHICLNQELSRLGCNNLDLALGFVKSLSNLEAVIIGVSKLTDLTAIISSWNANNFDTGLIDTEQWAWTNTSDIDPRQWPI